MKNVIYDLESFPNFFLYGDFDIVSKEYTIFEISDRKNDYLNLRDYLLKGNINYQIGFNNFDYDYHLIDFILSKNFYHYSGSELSRMIKNVSDYIINSQKNERVYIPEYKHKIKQIDLKKIWHFDNKAKLVSLKWIQFMIDWPNLEALPFDPDKYLNDVEKDKVIEYWYNDVDSTYEFFLITKGQTQLSEYKGKDKLKLRKNIKDRFGLNCLNYNDVKIGEMLLKNDYCKAEGLQLRDLKKHDLYREEKYTFGQCIPEFVKFQTKKFNDFFEYIKKQPILLKKKKDDEQSFTFTCNGTHYTIARGGIHSEDKPRIIKPNSNQILRDADVGSQYPNAIRKRRLKPRHLTESWLINYGSYIDGRIQMKSDFKKTGNPEFKSFDECFKLALNGGSFGKLGEETNWQRDEFTQMQVTIGNQFEILMLIEMFELEGIHVVSANTDGVVALFDKSKDELYYSICHKWEDIVGNHLLGKLEYADYSMLAQTSVNDYIAQTIDGKVKKKGDFLTDFEIHKNKSRRITAIALEQYFINKILPEKTIKEHKNIYDFCLSIKGNNDSSFYLVNLLTDKREKLQKINRFYISNSKDILIKELPKLENKKPTMQLDIFGEVDDGTRISRIEVGYNVTIFNRFVEKNDYDINYNYYISKCYEIINNIENEECLFVE